LYDLPIVAEYTAVAKFILSLVLLLGRLLPFHRRLEDAALRFKNGVKLDLW
jgi:hypothetical protein